MKYFFLLLFANICLAVNAQNKSEKAYLIKSLSGESIDKVVSETSGGNIIVTAVGNSEIRVEVYINENNNWQKSLSDDEIKNRVNNDYDLNISVSGSKLTATAKSKHRITDWKKSLSFSFKIYVPKSAEINLLTSGGNIELTGMSGLKDFKTSGGNLVLKDLEGRTKGSTSGGNVYLRNSKNDLDLSTSGGNIDAENSSGNISISTSGGSIRIEALKGIVKVGTSGGNIKGDAIEGDLSANTSGGNISLQGLNCSLKTATSGGNIDVSMISLGKFVSIHNSAGKVNLQIPKNIGVDLKLSAMKISTGTMENFKGNLNKEEINGALNGGGIPVTVDAGGGKINLEFN
ncbi:MAG TPA: hypothetical protein VGP55_10305 [Chitinophagaceae bacterium]|nr:hypothetical protein [Chitinophagaceae bacterium]